MAEKRSQHVVPSGDGWAVRKAGSSRATERFDTQRAAAEAATRFAKNQGTEVFIHGEDGRIRERNSYGNDPRSSKG